MDCKGFAKAKGAGGTGGVPTALAHSAPDTDEMVEPIIALWATFPESMDREG